MIKNRFLSMLLLLAAVAIGGVAQTARGVRAGTNTTKVNTTNVTTGQVVSVDENSTVTVTHN